MLADNIVFLREAYPAVYKVVKSWEEMHQAPKVFFEEARDGNLTLKCVEDKQSIYLHSKYNPIREAQVIVENFSKNQTIDEQSHVVFYGIGFGYHIEAFITHYPKVSYTIIEPSAEIFANYLDKKIIKKNLNKNLLMLQCGNQADDLLYRAVQFKDKNLVILEHPAYPNLFKKEYSDFLDAFHHTIREQRGSLMANNAFQLRWIINSVNNFKYVLNTPNVLMEEKNIYSGKTAIIVSAGPSLDYELENLKKIKEGGLAYIFSVGSAINTLLHYDILPHAMCTYDPSELNQWVFDKMLDTKTVSVPMIFGSSVGYEIIEKYKGLKYHVITNQDTVAKYFLKPQHGDSIEIVHDAPSIAIVTLELLKKMKFENIILVGQNLSYLNDRHYAKGDVAEQIQIDRNRGLEARNLTTIDVEGNEVDTNESFMKYKQILELYIKQLDIKVYNTTIGGARIEGTEFRILSSLISEELKEKQIENEFVTLIQNEFYDKEYLNEQVKKMKKEFERYKIIVNEIRFHIAEINSCIKINYINELEKKHSKMDGYIRELEVNDFFVTIALPVFRVEYGLLLAEIKKYRCEKKSIQRSKSIIQATERFMNTLYFHRNIFNDINFVITKTAGTYLQVMQ